MNPQPKYNPIVLDKIMMNIWIKWAMDFKYKKSQQDRNIANKLTKYKVQKMSITFF